MQILFPIAIFSPLPKTRLRKFNIMPHYKNQWSPTARRVSRIYQNNPPTSTKKHVFSLTGSRYDSYGFEANAGVTESRGKGSALSPTRLACGAMILSCEVVPPARVSWFTFIPAAHTGHTVNNARGLQTTAFRYSPIGNFSCDTFSQTW